jgi:hypothetical protein
MIYHKALDGIEREQIDNYVSAKYNLPVSNDRYDGDDSANGDFDYNVTGIFQKSGGSQTSASSNGMTVTDNGFLQDNEDYLYFGHEDLDDIAEVTTDLPSGYSSGATRLNRVWYFDITDNTSGTSGGDVDITFDLSELGFTNTPNTSNASNYRLLKKDQGASGSFSEVSLSNPTLNGDQITFTGVSLGAGNDIEDGFTYTLASTDTTNSPLPVELTSFTVQQEGKRSARLEWSTASETNNKHFLIQRRRGDQWQRIGRVEGHGTTTVPQDYRFTDNGLTTGTHYYHLKQVDFDGSYEYSDVKAVAFEGAQQVASASLSLHPNPVADQLSVEFRGSKENTTYQVQIRSSRGEVVYRDEVAVQQGRLSRKLPVSALPPGAYVLTLQGPEQPYHVRFIKQE